MAECTCGIMGECADPAEHTESCPKRSERYRVCFLDTGYEQLIRADGTIVTTITEPEDRTFARDLWAIVEELNLLARTGNTILRSMQ